jgi:hexulose-6-phosphate isomerase
VNNPIGIMQGRLSAPRGGRLQSFPWDTWEDEFARARACGLDGIEWIVEEPWRENPLSRAESRGRIETLSRTTGVQVPSACADYFMERPLVRTGGADLNERIDVLRFLIGLCGLQGIRILDIPFVDASAINNAVESEHVAAVLGDVASEAQRAGVVLGLETNLAPRPFEALLRRIDHPAVGATYDIGNSASLGFDPHEEIDSIGRWIVNVHVKDRVRHGGTVALGQGNADLPTTFARLRDVGYQGPLILQVARGDGNEMDHARQNADLVRRLWNTERVSA